MRKIFQPQNNFFQPAVPPLANTTLRLPGGKDEPFYYSLGADSTIPFVSLSGGGSTQKVVSWGEMIEVHPGQVVTVKNESFMQGDISINSGHDFAAKPERISLPVPTIVTNTTPFGVPFVRITSLFPADTRRCRRAFLVSDIITDITPQDIVFTGKPVKHSFIGVDSVTGLNQYQQKITIPPLTRVGSLSMGYGIPTDGLFPPALTDQVSFEFSYFNVAPFKPTFINSLFYYVLEY